MNINPEKIEAAFCEHAFLSELSKGHIFKDMVTDIKHVGDDLSLKVKFGYPIKSREQKIRDEIASHLIRLFNLKTVTKCQHNFLWIDIVLIFIFDDVMLD